jgi:uncharacterized delta-60 repeat protein
MPKLQTLVRLLLGWALVSSTCSAAPGDLDATFGSGTVKVITQHSTGNEYAYAIALQPDKKMVVGGYCYNGSDYDFCLARYLPNGALDTSFNSTGKVLTPIGPDDESVSAVAVQLDGKIVAAGYCSNGRNNDFCLARFLPNGALDTTFNTTGKVITAIGPGNDTAFALALQPDGKIIVAGYCSNGSNNDFCLVRYLANGTLDTNFNSTGTVLTSVGTADGFVIALALQPDGKIVAAGRCSNNMNYDFCLVRYLSTGQLDASFNTTGKVVKSIGPGNSYVSALALQADGKIVVTGFCSNGTSFNFCLARYLPSGQLDTSFNAIGTTVTPVGAWGDTATAVALQPDGKIIVVGFCDNSDGHFDFCLARYLGEGILDMGFNANGKVITPIGSSDDYARAVALQADGRIVVAGGCSNGADTDFCLVRYEGGPFDARNCSLDIDGDNQVLATTDMLIGTRIALGMSGPSVLSGIAFASYATRTTWPAIRDYLVSQCGMSIVP